MSSTKTTLELEKLANLSPAESRWWLDAHSQTSVNGILKGRGAQGIFYTGALFELRDYGYWFHAVAGSSAGAITATLIAAGLDPEAIVKAVLDGLRSVKKMPLGDVIGSPLYQTEKVALWLEGILSQQVSRLHGKQVSGPITFDDLYTVSGIELYVVAVDVADRQPRVFSTFTTPGLSIVDAVLASSAIPMAFRPGRLEVRDTDERSSVHRLMDGGVWANYPAFVFKDPSFRAYHHLSPLPENSITIGFTLDTAPPFERTEAIRLRRDTNKIPTDKGAFLPWIFRFGPLRLYLMTFWPLVIVAQLWYTLDQVGLVFLKDYATRNGVPTIVTQVAAFIDGFTTNFMLHSFLFPAFVALLVVLALFLAVIGGSALDSGLPAVRTLMTVGSDVPYWVGAAPNDYVVRLRIPSWIKTSTFKMPKERSEEAISESRAQAREQLSPIFSRVM